jgi:RHS repeat-associated protein
MHVNQNGQDYYTPIFDQQTLYANPLITINDKGYTKHYFEEGKRICSKIGSGGLIIDKKIEGISQGIEEIRDIQRVGVVKTFDMCMQLYPYIKTNNLHKTVVKPYEGQINPGEPIFYYHSDHLGSASFLTDTNGIETQQLVYLPFGEDWVDMKYNTSQYDTPYKFNGKEKDQETGYNNYGARYYYDWASIWLSVDPMSDKYPHVTNYIYCSNNPVMVVDPNGEDEWEVSNKGYITWKNNKGEGHTLYALDKYGKRNGISSKLDGNILSQLRKENIKKIDGDNVSRAKGNNGKEMLKAFKFLADNTDVEWRTDKKKDGTYTLGTAHTNKYSPSSTQMGGYSDKNVASMIHSHPTKWANDIQEIESMGKWNIDDKARGDWAQSIIISRNNKQFKSKVYFKNSKNVYDINIYHGPKKNSSGLKY